MRFTAILFTLSTALVRPVWAQEVVDPGELGEVGAIDVEGTAPGSLYLRLEGPGLSASVPTAELDTPLGDQRMQRRNVELEAQRAQLRPLLQALGAQVIGDHRRLTNALQVVVPTEARAQLRHLPGVAEVEAASIMQLSMNHAAPWVGAAELWARTTPFTGRGVRIAIVDSGIDYHHANFGGSGEPGDFLANDPRRVETGTFPTAKVVAGRDLVGESYRAGFVPEPDADPIDCRYSTVDGHGTLVASAAAGMGVTNTGAAYRGTYAVPFDPEAFSIGPGIAPEASLMAVKVFSCGQSTTDAAVLGLEWLVDPDGDGHFGDRPDVVNLSFGGAFGIGPQTEREAVEELLRLGVVVVAAVGNDLESRGYFAAATPSTIPGVIAVGGTLNQELHFANLVTVGPGGVRRESPAREATTARSLAVAGPINAKLSTPADRLACAGVAEDLTGKVALLERGTCSFSTKVGGAVAAGAVAVLVMDSGYIDAPIPMTGVSSFRIPVFSLRRVDGEALLTQLAAGPVDVALVPNQDYPVPYGPDALAGLSVRGPDARLGILKPDVVAPCCSVTLASSGQGNVGNLERGTSVSAPLVAGAAALLLQAYPRLSADEVKATLMNTARPLITLDGEVVAFTLQGAGRLDVSRAVDAPIRVRAADAMERTSLTFKEVMASAPVQQQGAVRFDQVAPEAGAYTVTAELAKPIPGVAVTLNISHLELGPGGTATATLTLSVDPALLPPPAPDGLTNASAGALGARHFLVEAGGHVRVAKDGVEVARMPFWAPVRAAHPLTAQVEAGCGREPIRVTLEGADRFPNLRSVVGAFQHLPNVGTGELEALGYAYADGVLYLAITSKVPFTTPANTGDPRVVIFVDKDHDEAVDYEIVTDGYDNALTDPPAFRDLLKSKVAVNNRYNPNFDLPHGFLNVIRPDEAPTFPFYSDVWVVPVRLADIGVTDPLAPIWIWVHLGTMFTRTTLGYAKIVPGRAELSAIHEGRPFWLDGQTIEVNSAAAIPGADLLLLNFTGGPGQRSTVLPLSGLKRPGGALQLHATAPSEIPGDQLKIPVQLHNTDVLEARDVVVKASIDGVVRWEGCAPPDCTLPVVAPDQAVALELTVSGLGFGSHDLELSVAPNTCATAAAPLVFHVERPEPPPPPVAMETPPVAMASGCGCTDLAPGLAGPGRSAFLVVFAAGGWLRSRRRRPRR